jgi:hypothetical protein
MWRKLCCNCIRGEAGFAKHCTFKLPNALIKHTIAPKVKKRKRSATPPETIISSDEAMFAEQEEGSRDFRLKHLNNNAKIRCDIKDEGFIYLL